MSQKKVKGNHINELPRTCDASILAKQTYKKNATLKWRQTTNYRSDDKL